VARFADRPRLVGPVSKRTPSGFDDDVLSVKLTVEMTESVVTVGGGKLSTWDLSLSGAEKLCRDPVKRLDDVATKERENMAIDKRTSATNSIDRLSNVINRLVDERRPIMRSRPFSGSRSIGGNDLLGGFSAM
jgi:hypothetical protein